MKNAVVAQNSAKTASIIVRNHMLPDGSENRRRDAASTA
jgi:hypothetical protein